jgi:hypothetical protein
VDHDLAAAQCEGQEPCVATESRRDWLLQLGNRLPLIGEIASRGDDIYRLVSDLVWCQNSAL